MDREHHARTCEGALGHPYHEVHDFLDQYSKRFPREHRKAYHHRQGLRLIADRFGLEAVEAAEMHIFEDVGFIPDDHTHFSTDNEELIGIVEGICSPNPRVQTDAASRSDGRDDG